MDFLDVASWMSYLFIVMDCTPTTTGNCGRWPSLSHEECEPRFPTIGWLEKPRGISYMIQDGDSGVQLPYKWLNSMVYGRYNELFNGVYKPTNITRGGFSILYGCIWKRWICNHTISNMGSYMVEPYKGFTYEYRGAPLLKGVCWFINPSYGHIRHIHHKQLFKQQKWWFDQWPMDMGASDGGEISPLPVMAFKWDLYGWNGVL